MKYNDHLKELLKDPDFAEAYNNPDPEFDLGIQLYKARKNSGLSQQQVAEITGINQGNYSKIEAGIRVPTVKTLQKITACLGVTIALIPIK